MGSISLLSPLFFLLLLHLTHPCMPIYTFAYPFLSLSLSNCAFFNLWIWPVSLLEIFPSGVVAQKGVRRGTEVATVWMHMLDLIGFRVSLATRLDTPLLSHTHDVSLFFNAPFFSVVKGSLLPCISHYYFCPFQLLSKGKKRRWTKSNRAPQPTHITSVPFAIYPCCVFFSPLWTGEQALIMKGGKRPVYLVLMGQTHLHHPQQSWRPKPLAYWSSTSRFFRALTHTHLVLNEI